MDLVNVYDTVTGRRLSSLPATTWTWRRQLSGSGSLSITIPYTAALADRDLREELVPWRTTIGIVDSSTRRMIAAGIVYGRSWDADSARLEVSCEDLWGVLKRRLVMPHGLDAFTTGEVAGQDGSYGPAWTLSLSGSLAGIAVRLVETTVAQGKLPVVLPVPQEGKAVRTYAAPDLGTVEARLRELTQVLEGPEVRFDPQLIEGTTAMAWVMMATAPELPHITHRWDARRRAVPLISLTVEEDSSDMVGDSWARGGSQDDLTLMAHHHDPWLQSRGWPLLQSADTSHSTVSQASTLAAHAAAPTVLRARSTEVVSLKARRTDEAGYPLADSVQPGDHIRLRHDDPYLGDGAIHLKALELSGDESEWVTVSCREVITNQEDG